jgi:ABC-2 type transport system permease protein
MKMLSAALWAECLKIHRSRMLWISLAAAIFIPSMVGVIMFVALHPETADKLGMFSTKATLVDDAGWPYYFTMLSQVIAGAGAIGFGFVTAWVFGREYSDRTVKDLLALPVSRSYIVLAKYLVVAAWCAAIALAALLSGVAAGWSAGLPGWSGELAVRSVGTFVLVSLMTMLLVTPVAFLASYGQGYLPPIGFVLLTLIMSQFVGLIGLGPYFPWAIPGLYTLSGSSAGMDLSAASYIIVALTFMAGLAATFAWWQYADQH